MNTQVEKVFNQETVRIIIDEDNNYWFCGKDVCNVLGYSKHRNTLSKLDEDERGPFEMDSPGGVQQMIFINERGLYSLILSSKKLIAKQFKKWVTSEVLPSIRKTGQYTTQKKLTENEETEATLKNIKLAISIFEDLGGLDERDKLNYKDRVRNLTMPSIQNQNLIENKEIALSDRIYNYHKIKQSVALNNQIINFGKLVKEEYKKQYNKDPPKRQQYVNGAPRQVNCYYESDYINFIDKLILNYFK